MKLGRGKRRRISWRDRLVKTFGGISDRQWTDPRDGVRWTVWLETEGDRPVLVFGSEGDTHTVVVDFEEGLWDLSKEDLHRFLDEAQAGS